MFVLCVHYKDCTWGMVHTGDMWVLGQLLGGGEGGQLQTHGFFLKSSRHMLLSPVHAWAGSSRNTRSLAVDQMGFDHLTHIRATTSMGGGGEGGGGGACAKKHPFVRSLHGNGHTQLGFCC